MQGSSKGRLELVLAVMAALCGLLIVRFFYWQILSYDEMSRRATEQREKQDTIPARRGDILTTDGQLLATDVYQYEVDASPGVLRTQEDLNLVVGNLSPLLNIPQAKLFELLQDKSNSYVVLTRTAPADVGPKLEKLRAAHGLPGVTFKASTTRRYPANSFVAQVIGFLNQGHEARFGVEAFYQDKLKGKDGLVNIVANADKDGPLPFEIPISQDPINGASLYLTVNSAIQYIAERELQKAVISNGATGGSLIVMEPRTGAIRAMAVYPTANLNDYASTTGKAYDNNTVTGVYEPGSVFKIVTVSCAIDAGTINRNTTFNDTGSYVVGGRVITNHDNKAHGIVDVYTVLKDSLNVETAKIAVMMGATKFYDCVRRFGFGSPTNVDLTGETQGLLSLPGDGKWYESNLGANSYGQAISATPLQMASAVATLANKGQWTPPHIMDKMVYDDGRTETYQIHAGRQVLKPETAATMTSLLSKSITGESFNKASVPGYSIAGKTGTSSIPIPGGYEKNGTIASFGGYFPADQPSFVIMIKIDRPKASDWGSEVASPVFAAVAQQIAALVGLPPDAERIASK